MDFHAAHHHFNFNLTDEQFRQFLESTAFRSREQIIPDGDPSRIDFGRYIKEWASQHGLTPHQAKDEIEKWVEEVRRKHDNLSDLALAEFYKKNFAKAGAMFGQSAERKLEEAERIKRDRAESRRHEKKLIGDAVSDLRRAGDAAYNSYDFRKALEHYTKAARYVKREEDSGLWAALQVDIGSACSQFGTRAGGRTGKQFLSDAVSAYRRALEVRTREDLPQDWAMTQNNLGNALQEQGTRTGGAEGAGLLGQAVSAYRRALEVFTREDLPQQWATTQNNLGRALKALDARTY